VSSVDPVQRIGRWAAIVATLVCVTPIVVLAGVATSPVWQQGWWHGGITTRWLTSGWERISPNVATSVRLAVTTAVIDCAIGLPAAWALARRRFRGRRLLGVVVSLPIAVPGIAVALGLILTFPTLKRDGWLIQAGHVLYTLPFLIGAIVPALAEPELQQMESTAATLGAGRLRQLTTITAPQIRSALLVAVLMVLTLSIGEFNVSFFLFTPTDQPLPVALYDGYLTGRIETAAATTVWFLAAVVPLAALVHRIGRPTGGQA
jgi:putative spermidine/putrescine transport system permease protein